MALKVVDISQDKHSAAAELLDAATTQGFLFISGHGYTPEQVEELFNLSKTCFDIPQEIKLQYSLQNAEENVGYTGFHSEVLDTSQKGRGDPKEAFNFGKLDLVTGEPCQKLPEVITNNSHWHRVLTRNILKLSCLARHVLELLAIGLDIDRLEGGPEWFLDRQKVDQPTGSALRLLRYPGKKSLDPDADVRAGAHTDYGALTLLFQLENQPGLEILSPVSHKWELVPYIASTRDNEAAPLVVNIGDLLSYWTAGLLRSTIHRVRFPPAAALQNMERFSIVFFSHPNDDTLLEPVPSPRVRLQPLRGATAAAQPITAKQHLDKRLAQAYGWS